MVSSKGGEKVAMVLVYPAFFFQLLSLVKGMFNFVKIPDRKLEDAIESLLIKLCLIVSPMV